MTRSAAVEEMITRALRAFEEVDHTDSEALSASFTLSLRMLAVIRDDHPEQLPVLRQAVEMLLLACADTRQMN